VLWAVNGRGELLLDGGFHFAFAWCFETLLRPFAMHFRFDYYSRMVRGRIEKLGDSL
jgi:hypothetical protein